MGGGREMSRRPLRRLPSNALAEPTPSASICAAAWVFLHPEVGDAAARLFVTLAQHVKKGTAYPGMGLLARRTGRSVRAAQRAIAELLEHPEAPLTRKLRPKNLTPIYSLTRFAFEAPRLANESLRAHDNEPTRPGDEDVAPRGDAHDAPGAGPDAPGVTPPGAPSLTRALGVSSGTLTLKNLPPTDNGNENGAWKEGRVGRPEATPIPATVPASLCAKCGRRPAEPSGNGRMLCEVCARPWGHSGGRL